MAPSQGVGSSSFRPEPDNNGYHVRKKQRTEEIPRQKIQLTKLPQQQQIQSKEPLQQQQIMESMIQIAQMQQQQQIQHLVTYGVCSRRLMQCLYYQRHKPSENTTAYWNKFVSEYYCPRATKRWCYSKKANQGQWALGIRSRSNNAWNCNICCKKSGKGFEAPYRKLARMYENYFGSVVLDELLFLDCPNEYVYHSRGLMVLDCSKAVIVTVYQQIRVAREGHLRVVFTKDLKILFWEFCELRHKTWPFPAVESTTTG